MKLITDVDGAVFPAAEVFAGFASDHTEVDGVRQITLTPYGSGSKLPSHAGRHATRRPVSATSSISNHAPPLTGGGVKLGHTETAVQV